MCYQLSYPGLDNLHYRKVRFYAHIKMSFTYDLLKYSQLIQYEILEKLVTRIAKKRLAKRQTRSGLKQSSVKI